MRRSDLVTLSLLASCFFYIIFFVYNVSHQMYRENALSEAFPNDTPLLFMDKGNRLVLSNGYLFLEFNKSKYAIDVLKADFFGKSHYGRNLVPKALTGESGLLSLVLSDTIKSTHAAPSTSNFEYKILIHDNDVLQVEFKSTISGNEISAKSNLILTLLSGRRKFNIKTSVEPVNSAKINLIKLCFHFNQWFMNGFFDKGVVQNISSGNKMFYSEDPLNVFYTIDNKKGSVSVVPVVRGTVQGHLEVTDTDYFKVGIESVLFGSYTQADRWVDSDQMNPTTNYAESEKIYKCSYDIYANNYPFPVHSINNSKNMNFDDLRIFYSAIYGSAAGVLGTYKNTGSAYPNLVFPGGPYGDMYTFFDPDARSTVSTLSFSGDVYLQNQAREIIELAERNMKSGQIPHHFIANKPKYLSIAKSEQPGPNIFWVLASIDYASATGDNDWLKAHYNKMKEATDHVLKTYDPEIQLVKVNGPLFIDVFIRNNFTLDTNVMLLRLLPLMSDIARLCNDEDGAERYLVYSKNIKSGINEQLWDGNDHYFTQKNVDGTIRDMVDYDGNYAAIAFGAVTDEAIVKSIFKRLDGGENTHPNGYGTWPSEKTYEETDCYGENTGDSDVAFARIWWLDMFARYVSGDLENFNVYFNKLGKDLIDNTWMRERYDSKGFQTRAHYYHEYPEIITMVLREMIYGINIKPGKVIIKPFGKNKYFYKLGNLEVSYDRTCVELSVPGTGFLNYAIYGLLPDTKYSSSVVGTVLTDNHGMATFKAPAGMKISIRT